MNVTLSLREPQPVTNRKSTGTKSSPKGLLACRIGVLGAGLNILEALPRVYDAGCATGVGMGVHQWRYLDTLPLMTSK